MDKKIIILFVVLAFVLLSFSTFYAIIYHNIHFRIDNVRSYKLDVFLDELRYSLPDTPEKLLQCDTESIWVNIIDFNVLNNNEMTFLFQNITMDDHDAILVYDYTIKMKNNIFVGESDWDIMILSNRNYSEFDIGKLQPIWIKFGRPLLSFKKRLE